MKKPIPLEESDPELAEMLMEVVKHNVSTPKKDHIVVDFESEQAYYKTARVEKTINRNDPCSCGSGKKHKKCCMRK
jgi:uncharacterized protein YecA (UPF0149 family)